MLLKDLQTQCHEVLGDLTAVALPSGDLKVGYQTVRGGLLQRIVKSER